MWIVDVCVVHDDIRRFFGATSAQVHDLARHIATVVLRLDHCFITPCSIAAHGSSYSHVERRLNPDCPGKLIEANRSDHLNESGHVIEG